jgi:adenosylcobyric acid synthase
MRRSAAARARTLFVGGTSSNAGKSWMVTAICAWLRQRGMSVAPFKAQNMSNNSYPCRSGGEIGRAQVAQAEACGIEPEPAMNPVLLKPSGNGCSQVVVNGKMWRTLSAREYYAAVDELRPVVLDAFADLARRFDAIVVEGAGSVSELNLREHDLVNLGLATRIRAPWMLVADIERGGVFGSIVGTMHLLTREERALFRGFAVNKFHGDPTLFEDGVRMLEQRTGAHCFGVFPHVGDIYLDGEDSLALDTRRKAPAPPGARIAIVRFPHLSNATDFRLLTWADWIRAPSPDTFEFIVLPGSKNTLADLAWLRRSGLAEWIGSQHRQGATIVGVCGGFQMLGREVTDPLGIESGAVRAEGLGLLPATTVLTNRKKTRVVQARTRGGAAFGAYEIHVGVTTFDAGSQTLPFAVLDDDRAEGACADRVLGTYLHGAFESADVCAEYFRIPFPYAVEKAAHYERLADWLTEHGRELARLGFD